MITGHDNLELTANFNSDLVLLGSSRCWAHFDPHFFEKTFKQKSVNIGVDGHSELSMVYLRLKDYLSRNEPPKYAILNLDPFMSAGNEINNNNFVHKNDFARYSFFPDKKNLLFVDYFKFSLVEKYIPLYSFFKYKILDDCLFIKESNDFIKYGYEIHNYGWDTIANPVTDKMKETFFTKEQIPTIINSLERVRELCTEYNIKLLCIQTPVYKVIHDEVVFSYANEICKTLNITFIDSNLEYIRNDIKYFYNSYHLNKKGVDEMNLFLSNNIELKSFFE